MNEKVKSGYIIFENKRNMFLLAGCNNTFNTQKVFHPRLFEKVEDAVRQIGRIRYSWGHALIGSVYGSANTRAIPQNKLSFEIRSCRIKPNGTVCVGLKDYS